MFHAIDSAYIKTSIVLLSRCVWLGIPLSRSVSICSACCVLTLLSPVGNHQSKENTYCMVVSLLSSVVETQRQGGNSVENRCTVRPHGFYIYFSVCIKRWYTKKHPMSTAVEIEWYILSGLIYKGGLYVFL